MDVLMVYGFIISKEGYLIMKYLWYFLS